ncbi:N-acetyltransferase [Citrobacter rodentium]|uniref:Acetyltransferase n=2 Tax=Citrobacter rodentium TaxID=67825 RepID=D2TJV7_CITRI|nr:N-acetyltransferase [Citrobacter rodentium]KIQ53118.1 acetyltransferase [Citrobacter rodentium]QBY30539.1 N-acetyltransferase [Citrobacter rodentium]UHO32090.1 N-acetyltransferase [Citrobacter rodentium NBRC 105723 = DSM 16636]CBG90955.1 putative acetyltransferase [Citrobacter rodentium ICC168]HAT8013059.1 GNAT family N-acetyltransferase [Citrobacter rodentium NBRC 105723 = DSM 16636]
MIRESRSADKLSILALWLESTIYAHPFIPEYYWYASEAIVRDSYLPAARTWVWEEQEEVKGFINVLENRFLGALFVAPDALRRGIGKALVQHVQQRFSQLSLEVYQKNLNAVHFYHAQGFRIEDSAWQEETHHPTWIMSWRADQTQ